LIDVFNEYVSGVVGGEIVTGRYVRLSVERHLKDVANQGTEAFPYTFDEHAAGQAISAFPALFRHTIGTYAGQPFELAPWQAFIVGSIWGWKDKNNLRRFRRAYVTLARKNGKSTLAAGICILLAQFDNEHAAQVFIGATKVDQAKLIFNEASRMIGASENLRDLADRRVLQINFDSTNSFIRPLGSDRAFDGLNPSGIIFDELHAWKEQHRAFYDTLTTGSASRSQPLRFTITTAGDTNSLLWIEEETIAKALVEGTYEEESYFAYIATLDKEDDPFDEANWIKSMPTLNVSVSPDYIREQVKEAKVSKVAENRFRRYFANIQVSPNEAAVDLAKWDSCQGGLSDWSSADVVTCGIDMGGRNDLAAVAYCARYPDGENEEGEREYRYEIITKAYMDSDTSRDLNEMPWLQWVGNGDLNVVPYVHTAIYEEINDQFVKYGRGRQIGFDPWSTQQLSEQLDQEGFQCIQIQQNRFKLHEPTTLLLDLIEKKKITHNGDGILRWCAGNMVLSIDNASRIMPDKKNSSEKIDCVVAAIMALKLASLAPESPRGPMFIS
jgi:phage terminase large subunit-like protein